ncbi:putative zinc-binding oxidoreductase ToxD [Aaosphaeria arxii CBS 175.79]|uniref:Putative zinc-binding oxidoreductase ToxD n=1 Tax=Aaosphaeria arxii CBS 175.79 TaxID=1450172 RepID=A0A6A5XRG4_9PLEO|nr:putative zinc-binding oxidoreductase ToxD [Aaosphaeria arxii CBS 175.79]KAF2015280.1 putative zinc-binding oxidoreductase ToxD [Aaosphaeria arxii CBS 175.79]
MKAVQILEKGKAGVVDVPIPKIRPNSLLIRTIAVALNPTDWKHVGYLDTQVTVGCDWSGIVEEVGSEVTKPFKKGDRVWGFNHGSNIDDPEGGAFGEYLITLADFVMRIPEGMGFEEAASSGSGILTVGQGLYQEMGLPWPSEPLEDAKPLFIYGGSSATGALGIQFAKLSGFEVITACSPRNFEYVQSLGASKVFDINSNDLGAEIRAYTDDKLYYAWDCVGGPNAFPVCTSALASSAPEGQKIIFGTIVNSKERPRDDVTYTYSIGYSAAGKSYVLGGVRRPAQPDHYDFTKKWTEFAEKLRLEGKWKAHRQEVRDGGFEGILGGMQDMKDGKVSGVKLVYRVGEP